MGHLQRFARSKSNCNAVGNPHRTVRRIPMGKVLNTPNFHGRHNLFGSIQLNRSGGGEGQGEGGRDTNFFLTTGGERFSLSHRMGEGRCYTNFLKPPPADAACSTQPSLWRILRAKRPAYASRHSIDDRTDPRTCRNDRPRTFPSVALPESRRARLLS